MNKTRLINIFWLFFEKFGLILLSACSFFSFAYFLTPLQLGLGAIVIVLCEMIGSFYNAVFENPLVKRNCTSKSELSSVFWFGGAIALVSTLFLSLVYFVLDENSSTWAMLLFSSISVTVSVQSRPFIASYRCKREFKTLALRTLWGKVVGALTAILAAAMGAGEWSLIIQLTVMNLTAFLILMKTDTSFLKVPPSVNDVRSLGKEGMSIGVRQLLTGLFDRGLILLLSITTSSSTVGYYSFARRLVDLPKQAIKTAVNSYSLPVFAGRVDRPHALSLLFQNLTTATFLILCPCFVYIGLFGGELVVDVFGEKWAGSVPFFVLFSFIVALQSLELFAQPLQAAFGKSNIGLKADIFRITATLALAYYAIQHFGLMGVAGIILIDVMATIVIRYFSVKKLISFARRDLLIDLVKTLATTSLVASLVHILFLNYEMSFILVFSTGVVAISLHIAIYYLVFGRVHERFKLLLNDKH